MIELRLLGDIGLRRREDGREIRSVLTQRKRVALLAYLALAPGDGYVPRDRLLGLFWLDASEERARHSLSQALYVLRRGLGRGIVEARGHQEVRVAPGALWCDALAFEEALEAGDREGALELYRGPLLAGLRVAAGPRFEKWLDGERRRLRERAVSAAGGLADDLASGGRAGEAVGWARRAAALAPRDEVAARRLLLLLAERGDRAAALEAHRRFVERLRTELEMEPSAEMLELGEELKEPPTRPEAVRSPGRTGRGPRARSPPAVRHASAGGAIPPSSDTGGSRDGDAGAADGPGTGEVPAAEGAGSGRGGRRRAAVGASTLLAVAAVALGAGLVNSGSSDRAGGAPSVAVLPFETVGSEGAGPRLARSFHGELVSGLTGVSGLTVIAPPAVRRLGDSARTWTHLADELMVDAVLAGRMRRSGDRFRLDVELVEPDGGKVLWREEFDRPLSTAELTRLESEVVGEVSSALRARMTPGTRATMARTPTGSLLAYEAYQRGRDQIFRFHDEEQHPRYVDRAVELFRRAVRRDRGFAEAHAGLAHAFASRYHLNREARWLDSAYAAARRARLLQPDLAEAHLALGYTHWAADSNRVALEHVRRAMEEKPSSYLATLWMVVLHDNLNQYDEGVRWARRLIRLDPTRPSFMDALAWELRCLGLYDAADAWARRALETQPDYRRAVEMRAYLLALRGRPGEGLRMFEEYVARHPSQPYALHEAAVLALAADRPGKARELLRRARGVFLRRAPEGSPSTRDSVPLTTVEAYAEILAGDAEAGRAALRHELERARRHGDGEHTHAEHFDLATVHAAMGEREVAMDHLEAAYRKGRRNYWWMKIHPLLERLRDEPRYRALEEAMLRDVERMRRHVLEMGVNLYPDP